MDSTVTTMVLVVKADILDPVPFLFSVLYSTQFRYCNRSTLWWLLLLCNCTVNVGVINSQHTFFH
jgi:hypothetical protein